MSRSPSSRSSVASSRSSKAINFRTITRDRSTHQLVQLPTREQQQPTQYQLEKSLFLGDSGRKSKQGARRSSVSQGRFFKNDSPQLPPRKIQSSMDWKQSTRDPTPLPTDPQLSLSNPLTLSNRQSPSRSQSGSRVRQPHSIMDQRESRMDQKELRRRESPSRNQVGRKEKQQQNLSRFSSESRGELYRSMETGEYELQRIDRKINELIAKKLVLVKEHLSEESSLNKPLFSMKSVAIDGELRNLLVRVIKMKDRNLGGDQQSMLDKKIEYIESILAEKSTERELMKKYYLKLTANKPKLAASITEPLKSKAAKAFQSWMHFQVEKKKQIKDQLSTPRNNKATFQHSSVNKTSFKKPNPEDYEKGRERAKAPEPNLQPLPRSSYKRDYLVLKTQPLQKFSMSDNKGIFPSYFKNYSSNYSKDFKRVHTDLIDHKQIDAYKDKFSFLKMSYMPKKKSEKLAQLKEGRQKRERGEWGIAGTVKHGSGEKEQRGRGQLMVSEAKRQFVWGNHMDRSKIKHKKLHQLQYKFKDLYKA